MRRRGAAAERGKGQLVVKPSLWRVAAVLLGLLSLALAAGANIQVGP